MISFWRIFWLELQSLKRSKTLAMLLAASVGWMLAFPHLVKGDGTADGARELYVHFSLGGVFALLVIALLASATGSLAAERTARRLQLTMVRPVRFVVLVLAKICAQTTVGAFVLGVACALLPLRVDLSRPCSHVLTPVLPSPREEAKAMYKTFMEDPDTPEAVRRARKEVVLRLLAQRAVDHYQTIPTNATVKWTFDGLDRAERPEGLKVRLRFTNQFEMRQDVVGAFSLDGVAAGSVSNITQAVLEVPLKAASDKAGTHELSFANRGKSALMLRPRRDINLLTPADTMGRNLLRTYLGLVAVLTLVVAFGLFLSASLGRPVAMLVAFVALAVGEMSPSVVEQYPDELETNFADRIGLCITRFAAEVTRPVSAASPLEALAKDECVELADVLHLVAVDLVAAPLVLALLAAFVLPRKEED